MSRILVLNPNSSEEVTRRMAATVAPFADGLPELAYGTLAEAPAAIESDADTRAVAPLVAEYVAAHPAEAYVIGCFSDPGVTEARRHVSAPVVGIGEAGYLAALTLGVRFGVISILAPSVRRHAAHIARLGLSERLAGDRPLGLGVADLADAEAAVIATGQALRDQDGADVLVLACAGMGHHRKAVEAATGLPVVDPVQAAVFQAATALALGYGARE